MCVYIYIFIYMVHAHIMYTKTFILDVINRLTALLILCYTEESKSCCFVNDMSVNKLWQDFTV